MKSCIPGKCFGHKQVTEKRNGWMMHGCPDGKWIEIVELPSA